MQEKREKERKRERRERQPGGGGERYFSFVRICGYPAVCWESFVPRGSRIPLCPRCWISLYAEEVRALLDRSLCRASLGFIAYLGKSVRSICSKMHRAGHVGATMGVLYSSCGLYFYTVFLRGNNRCLHLNAIDFRC